MTTMTHWNWLRIFFVTALSVTVAAGDVVAAAGQDQIRFGLLGNQPSYQDLNPEERAAYDWAQANFETTFMSFAQIADDPAAFDEVDVIWWHHDESMSIPADAGAAAVTEALRSFVEGGGGVLLSGFAPQYVVDLDVETNAPDEIRRGPGESGAWGFYQQVPGHPIFAGLPNPFATLSAGLQVDNNICWWTDPDRFSGTWLSDLEWQSGHIVSTGEYELGEGRIIVVGAGAFEWHYQSGTNTNRHNLERYTENILRYLGPDDDAPIVIQDGLIAHLALEEGAGNVTREGVTGRQLAIANNFDNPEWPEGPTGPALRLDGFSTWIAHNLPAELHPTDGLTIQLWAAIEAYPVRNAAFVNQSTFPNAGYFLGMDRHGRWYLAVSVAGSWHTVWGDAPFPRNRWVHVAGTFSRETGLALYMNGRHVSSASTPNQPLTPEMTQPIMIGRNNHMEYSGIFPLAVMNGLIDDVRVYNEARGGDRIYTSFVLGRPPSVPDLVAPVSRFADDPHRPRFHPIPPANWTNEPHGLVRYDGEYHMFYQHNPNGPYWAQIHWGYMKSRDLVHWEHMPIALAPEPGRDEVGIWSGDAVDNDGVLTAIYTGVDGVRAGVFNATSTDGGYTWEKHPNNPVINGTPPGYLDFRDPFVWREGGTWYLVIGSGIQNVGGTALLYKSPDLVSWEYLGPLMVGRSENSGVFWEMPMVIPLGEGKHIFSITEVPGRNSYWIGTWANEAFQPDHDDPVRLEIINHFLSPTVTTTDDGRLVGIGIIPETRSSRNQLEAGWAHSFSLPREWRLLENGRLGQRPARELEDLRGTHRRFSSMNIDAGTSDNLHGLAGNQLEIVAEFEPHTARRIGLRLLRSPGGEEETVLYYDTQTQTITLDRNRSSLSSTVQRNTLSGPFELEPGENLKFHIFIDHSAIQVFVNDRDAFTTRVYPTRADSRNVDAFTVIGSARLVYLDAWEMNPIWATNAFFSGEPTERPERIELAQNYPNPFNPSTYIQIVLPEPQNVVLTVYDFLGRRVKTIHEGFAAAGAHTFTWDGTSGSGHEAASGIYFYRLDAGPTTYTRKMVLLR